MYLVDTNVWLELLLEQEKSEEVRRFFEKTPAQNLAITDFSIYSIGIILTHLNKDDSFTEFLSDVIEDSGVTKIHLDTPGLKRIPVIRKQFRLDFDDSYQYVAAETYGQTIVSFDSHFDRTKRGRKTPHQV